MNIKKSIHTELYHQLSENFPGKISRKFHNIRHWQGHSQHARSSRAIDDNKLTDNAKA